MAKTLFLANPGFCLRDTRHFRHFRRFPGSEERNLLSLWVECKSSFSPFFVKTTCSHGNVIVDASAKLAMSVTTISVCAKWYLFDAGTSLSLIRSPNERRKTMPSQRYLVEDRSCLNTSYHDVISRTSLPSDPLRNLVFDFRLEGCFWICGGILLGKKCKQKIHAEIHSKLKNISVELFVMCKFSAPRL